MSNYHRIRLHFVISLAGSLVFLFGVFILASGIMITNTLSKDEFIHSCQYWAGIPTILTGGVLLLTAVFLKKTKLWRYISLCFVLITMVLTLGVIIEESHTASSVHNYSSDCGDYLSDEECDKLKEADPWYYILLFLTDIVLVLCSFVMMLLFADWILSVVVPVLSHRERILSLTNSQTSQESLERLNAPQDEEQPWIRFDDVPLQTV